MLSLYFNFGECNCIIISYSFYTFSDMVEVKEIIVVCDPSYRDIFEGFNSLSLSLSLSPSYHFFFSLVFVFSLVSVVKYLFVTSRLVFVYLFSSDAKGNYEVELKFALPGKERQDSVYNGLQERLVFILIFLLVVMNNAFVFSDSCIIML